jgi:glucosyl-3-phosphoglycerate synthase
MEAPPTPLPTVPLLREWLATRSFPYNRFRDLRRIADAKRRRGLSVSLILPTLNVADTLRPILLDLDRLRSGETALLDQVIVVDGRSTDGTVRIAENAGVDVYQQDALMPQLGPALGKGDAMWRALGQVDGDVIAFADTDTRGFRCESVGAMLAPLLVDPDIQFVKAAFRRPFAAVNSVTPDGGGRVTELTAKPLFNLFFPPLTGFAQPLAGEFAGRRDLLRALPFFTGYGVETGLLIDTLRRVGLRAMAQVDVGTRQNRHQPLADLGRMSYAVLRTVLRRLDDPDLGESGRLAARAMAESLYTHSATIGGGFKLTAYHEALVERPPWTEMAEARGGPPAVPIGGA